jgi:hypothetical protein
MNHVACCVLAMAAAMDDGAGAASAGGKVRLPAASGSIELRARWEPLVDSVYEFAREYPLVRDLAPAQERELHGADRIQALLPVEPVGVGDRWRVDVDDVLPFLRQFHAGATAELHHDRGMGLGAAGGYGCLRLLDARHAEIVLRVHADFRIAGDGTDVRSSWYTPAQFRGRLVLDRASGEVVALEWKVPQQSANVDVNVAIDGRVICDIGRAPVMELVGGKFPEYGDGAVQIGDAAVDAALARAFYPFAELEWLELEAALDEARLTGKPLHVVALFGSLLDESC